MRQSQVQRAPRKRPLPLIDQPARRPANRVSQAAAAWLRKTEKS